MTAPELCPKCGERLPEDAPTGLCPSCLLAAALALPEPKASPDRFLSPTTPGTAKFVPPSAAALAPLFPHLEILGLLGHGGMGAVYKARQKKLDRLVALKIIRPEAAADPAFAERFNREARTLARLSHPHIVAVHDFGEVSADDGRTAAGAAPVFYFLMEYVDGANLRQLMDGRRLPSNQALAIVPQVCEALQFAHDEGVVHRDIKPENILIDSKGRVRIADFGLAKLVVGSADEFTLTGTHQVMGTPRYMAPEQMEGSHAVDHRADIYSLGVVFYEMLTGQVPAGHFDPPSKKADSDPKLDAIVLRAMAREPERRFQQANHLGSEVKSMTSGSAIVNAEHAQQSVRAGAMDADVPALSEFLSREFRAVYQWVAGSSRPESRFSASPQWLMLLVCLIAAATLMFPWFDIHITDTRVTDKLDGRYLVIHQNDVPAYSMIVTPLELTNGAVCGGLLGVLIIIQIVCMGRRHPSLASTLPRLLLCGLALAVVLLHRSDLQYLTVTVTARDFANPDSHNVFSSDHGLLDKVYVIHELHHVISLLPACFIMVGSLFTLLVLFAVDLKHAMLLQGQRAETRNAASSDKGAGRRTLVSGLIHRLVLGPAENPLQLSARLLMWMAVLIISGLLLLLVSAFAITESVPGDGAQENPTRIYLMAMMITSAALSLLQAVMAAVTSSCVRQGRFRGIAVLVCVLLLLPVSITWPITMPLAAWCLAMLTRSDVKRLFVTADDPVAGGATAKPDLLGRVAAWLRGAAGVLACSAVVTLVALSDAPYPFYYNPELLVFCVTQVLCFPLAVAAFVAAGEIKERRLRTLALIVSGLFLLPLSPAWLMTLPVGAWSLSVLLRRDIAAAFLESDKPGAKHSAKPRNGEVHGAVDEPTAGQPRSAMPSAGDPETERRGREKSPHVSDTNMVAILRQEDAAPPVHVADLSPLRKAWNEFWAGRNLWLTKAAQNILGLAFVLCFFLFISFSTHSTVVYPTPGGPGVRATFVSFGTPSPWFELSQNAGESTGGGFQWKVLWYSSANVVMLLGLLAYWISYQIEKAKPDFKPSRFGSPTAVSMLVGAVAVLCILLGHLPLLMPEWKQTLGGDARTPLLIAVEKGNAEEVKSLLKDGVDPNQQLQKGLNSPLWWAVANGDSEIFEALITAQASVDFKNDVGVTPLMLASARGDIAFVSALISEGAQVNAQDTVTIDTFSVPARTSEISWPGQRLTPLMLAANSGYRDVVEALLQAGADAGLRNAAGQTAAEMALSRNYREVHDLILGSLRPSLERPATARGQDDSPSNIVSVHIAIGADDVDQVKRYLHQGVPINQRDHFGETLLEHAVIAGRERIVALLVLRGADTLQRDAQGRTPLIHAIGKNQIPVVRMLLDLEKLYYDKDVQFRMTRIDSDLKPDADFSVMRFDSGIDAADADGVTPDMKAAALGHTAIFQMIAMQRLCDDFDTMGRSWISHAIENRQEAFLVEIFDGVNSQIPQLPPNHGSGSRITPELLAHADASGRLPLVYARELGLTAVAERIEAFCRLTIEKCDRDLAASPDYADYNNKTRELCLKALGESQ